MLTFFSPDAPNLKSYSSCADSKPAQISLKNFRHKCVIIPLHKATDAPPCVYLSRGQVCTVESRQQKERAGR